MNARRWTRDTLIRAVYQHRRAATQAIREWHPTADDNPSRPGDWREQTSAGLAAVTRHLRAADRLLSVGTVVR